ncbi:MAG: DMT family transporter [Desulfuromonadaceae bacterium]|nr:DMT family transporter [Desulfuromonadaceae bacterium]MDD5106831.1 DMT family transporter [Desulfuromonadaceae bacterium]
MSESARGTFYAMLAVFMFATLGTGFKVAVTRMNSYSVVVWIGVWATAALFSFVVREQNVGKVVSELRQRPLFFPLAGAIGLGVQQILCLMTYDYIPASQAIILHYTYPLMMLPLSWLLFREKSGWKSILCVFLGFCGVAILVSAGSGFGSVRLSIGVAIALGTAISFALFCVLIKHADFSVIPGMFLLNLFGLLFLLCLLPLYPMQWALPWTDMLLMAYLGTLPTAVAFILWNKALRMIPTGRSSNCALLVPILSLVIIATVLKERIMPLQAVGSAIVLLSVFLNVRSSGRV